MDSSPLDDSVFAGDSGAKSKEHDLGWSVSHHSLADARILSLGNGVNTMLQGEVLTVHSANLSCLITDAIRVQSGQKSTGSTLVFHEPYAALMHHMPDLEKAHTNLPPNEGESTANRTGLRNALATLLDFLRPKYQKRYIPAQEKLSQERPTVKFDDLWILFQPDSLAFAKIGHHWVGCKVAVTTKWPADPEKREPARYEIGIWLLQSDWSTEKIGCGTRTYKFMDFGGEKDPTQLDVVPCRLYDRIDGGKRSKLFKDRGQKILDILWSSSRQYRYDGEALQSRQFATGAFETTRGECVTTGFQHWGGVLIAGTSANASRETVWWSAFTQPYGLVSKDDPEYSALERMIDCKKDSRDVFTETMRFMFSPCLSAVSLEDASMHLIHVDTLQTIHFPETLPEPILHRNQLQHIISLTEWQEAGKQVVGENYAGGVSKGATVLLLGGNGVGKRYTAQITMHYYCSMAVMGDLTHLDSEEESVDLILNQVETVSFVKGIVKSDDAAMSYLKLRAQLTIVFGSLDYKRQKKLWLNIMDIYHTQQNANSSITFEKTVSNFFSSANMPKVPWNGHQIKHCLRNAVSSAQAARSPNQKRSYNSVVVEFEHLKQAMNMAYASRLAIDSITSPLPPPGPGRVSTAIGRPHVGEDSDTSDEEMIDYGGVLEYDELSEDESPPSPRVDEKALPAKSFLCIPELNTVEWGTFKTLGATELFRSKRFYAIDVLVGEPHIWRELPSLDSKKRRSPVESIAPQPSTATTNRQQNTTNSAADKALPERIRINSPAITKAFSELQIDESSALRGSFLLFRPYKVLLYYEKELRDWTEKLEEKIKPSSERPEGIDEDDSGSLQADIAEMKCLLSFIDKYLDERRRKLLNSSNHLISFDDLWFLFKPGNAVIRKDMQQAYRVVRVATTRHQIKQHKETSLSYYKDQALVEFEDRYLFVKCVHIDLNGILLGPVLDIFPILEFEGEKAVNSLPVYPIEFCRKPGLRDSFIKRGRVFATAGGIEHMHYRGLTLPAEESSKLRDEVDSQVVIDFEEAINRYPEWMPQVERTILEENDNNDSSDDEEEWMSRYSKTQNRVKWKCIPGCCSRETVHQDDFIDDRTRTDYMAVQANENSSAPSAAIMARNLSDGTDNLRDDDFLIMSYRVFGFVLRSRKWHQLDLAYASPAEINSEGFDQLVLPAGHKDVVTSMITKHFRDKRSASSARTQADIVRGKGRGLIVLLHGVPGVGKTSTAECLADVFNRPLFQVTSGDLGITAGDVDKNLEENFSLANRWNCILLIDEADVFLAQRNKEDFVQNSLVAVFLRIMEYYSGVLFLTTNRVGVFDEAFTSRIHITLYYPPLTRQQTLEIFRKNWERVLIRSQEEGRPVDIDQSEITQFAMDYFDNNKQGRWNGRQIRNAFQSALAMAEYEVLGLSGVHSDDNATGDDQKPAQTIRLGKKHFEEVAKAYKGFVDYLKKVYGADFSRRARENLWRFDAEDDSAPKRPTALAQRLKFTDSSPMQQQPQRHVDPGLGPSQYPRSYTPGYETASGYGPIAPTRGGAYAGPSEFHSPTAYAPRTHGMEQTPYHDVSRVPAPDANYSLAQQQAYGSRMYSAPQHGIQNVQLGWAGSTRQDTQPGGYPHHLGGHAPQAAGGSDVRWEGGNAPPGDASSGQQAP